MVERGQSQGTVRFGLYAPLNGKLRKSFESSFLNPFHQLKFHSNDYCKVNSSIESFHLIILQFPSTKMLGCSLTSSHSMSRFIIISDKFIFRNFSVSGTKQMSRGTVLLVGTVTPLAPPSIWIVVRQLSP